MLRNAGELAALMGQLVEALAEGDDAALDAAIETVGASSSWISPLAAPVSIVVPAEETPFIT